MPCRNAVALLVGLLACVGLVSPAASRAHGDPASNYLPTADIFVPTDPPAASNLRMDLDNLVFAARLRGYVVKIAVIGSRTDLEPDQRLFGHPQAYARHLGSEIRSVYDGRLLVVMPQGFGTMGMPKRETQALSGVAIDGTSSDGLVRAGMAALRASAAAAGLKLPVLRLTPAAPPTDASSSGSPPARAADRASRVPVIPVVAGIVCVLLVAGVGLLAWRRPRTLSHDGQR